jgi:hypothetical protein
VKTQEEDRHMTEQDMYKSRNTKNCWQTQEVRKVRGFSSTAIRERMVLQYF